MRKLLKQHKITLIPWACPVFPLANLKLALVRTKIEKCDMQFVTETFTLHIYEIPQ